MICKNCLYTSSHPFGIEFIDGTCSGCVTHLEKYQIDWSNQLDKLKTIIKTIKKRAKTYDCVVPVVGDAEDYFVLDKVLKLGLNPLVVSVNDYFHNDIGWHNYHNLITYFNVDSMHYSPEMYTYKNLVAASLRKHNHVHLPFLQLHTAFPVHVAKNRKIPLIIWGQNQAVEQVGKFSHYDEVQMSRWSRIEHDLIKIDSDDLIGSGVAVEERKMNYYQYPNIKILYKLNIKGIYLSNYFLWDPLKQNAGTKRFGFTPEKNISSFDIYERSGSSTYYKIHDLLKFKRCGYRKVLDQINREIRHGRITREQGKELEKNYLERKIYLRDFFVWLDTTTSGYEWFKEKKLGDLNRLVSENDEIQSETLKIPSLEKFLLDGKSAERNYIEYGKGI